MIYSTGFTFSLNQNRSDLKCMFQSETFHFFLIRICKSKIGFFDFHYHLYYYCFYVEVEEIGRDWKSGQFLFFFHHTYDVRVELQKNRQTACSVRLVLVENCGHRWSEQSLMKGDFQQEHNFTECNCFIVSQMVSLYRETEKREINHGQI